MGPGRAATARAASSAADRLSSELRRLRLIDTGVSYYSFQLMSTTTLPTPSDLTITPRDRKFERGELERAPVARRKGRGHRHLQRAVDDLPGRRGLFRRERPRVPRRRTAEARRRRSRASRPRKRSTAASMPRSIAAPRMRATTCRSSKRRSSVGSRSPRPSRRSSASRRRWRSSISRRSSPMSC